MIFSADTWNLPPLICLYFPYLFSRGSLWKRAVNTKSYPSEWRSSIKDAWHRSVRCNSLLVWAVRVNFSHRGIFSSPHSYIQSASSQWKSDFPSPATAAFPREYLEFDFTLAFEIVHDTLIRWRNSAAVFSSGKYFWIAAQVDCSKIARATGMLCLQLPGWSTLDVNAGAALIFDWMSESSSQTLWSRVQLISPSVTQTLSYKAVEENTVMLETRIACDWEDCSLCSISDELNQRTDKSSFHWRWWTSHFDRLQTLTVESWTQTRCSHDRHSQLLYFWSHCLGEILCNPKVHHLAFYHSALSLEQT